MASNDLKILLKGTAKIKDRQIIIAISKEDKIKKETKEDGFINKEKRLIYV